MKLKLYVVLTLFSCVRVDVMASMRRVGLKGVSRLGMQRMLPKVSTLEQPRRGFGGIEVASVAAAIAGGLTGKLAVVGLKAGLAALGQDKLAAMLVRKYPFLKNSSGWIGTSIITMLVMHIDKISDDAVARQELLELWRQLTEDMQTVQDEIDAIAQVSHFTDSEKKLFIDRLQVEFENKFRTWLKVLPPEITQQLHQELEEEQAVILRQNALAMRSGLWGKMWGGRADASEDINQALQKIDTIVQSNKEKASHEELAESINSFVSGSKARYRPNDIFARSQRIVQQQHREQEMEMQKYHRAHVDDLLWRSVAPGHE